MKIFFILCHVGVMASAPTPLKKKNPYCIKDEWNEIVNFTFQTHNKYSTTIFKFILLKSCLGLTKVES